MNVVGKTRHAEPVEASIALLRVGLMTMFVVASAALWDARPAAAADINHGDDDPAAQYVRGFQERETLLAEIDARRRETAWLTANRPGEGTLATLADIDPEARKIFGELLDGDAKAVHERLVVVSSDAKQRIVGRSKFWQDSRAELNRRKLLLFESSQEQQAAGEWVSLMNFDNRWFWLLAVLAIASLVGLTLHGQRHEVRKVLHGGRSGALTLTIALGVLLLILFLATAATFLFGDRLYQSLRSATSTDGASPQQRIADVNGALDSELEQLRTQQDAGKSAHEAALDAWHRSLDDALPRGSSLAKDWRESREMIHTLSVHLAVEQRLVEAMQQDVAELASVDEQLQVASADIGKLLEKRRRVRIGFGLSLIALTTLCTLMYWWVDRIRRRQTANTCPRCGAEGSLAPLSNDRRRLRCNNRLSREADVYCHHTFAAAQRGLPKFNFPALGVGACGKTQWAAMVYRQLTEGRHPPAVGFRRNESAKSDALDQIVSAILNREGTPGTDPDEFPTPLCLTFRDRDRLGRTDVMACVFDYAGAVSTDVAADDYRRRRALDADGLLLLLDPTQPGAAQSKALAALGRDLRRRRNLKPDAAIRTPVAVC
ncbi:MAG: hypothetical protein IIA67_04240, partial [Planctomycetes bacterium]|nr:hypothetical protein [Planctomycetota bacterium]